MGDDYPLFQHWYKTLDWILTTVEGYPRNARFSIASRIADAGLDVMDLIVEAIYSKERIHILDRINVYMEKLRVLFRQSKDRRHISPKQHEYISRAITEAGKMVGGWRKHCIEKSGKTV